MYKLNACFMQNSEVWKVNYFNISDSVHFQLQTARLLASDPN